MSVFKCKMCGGTIEFQEGATVGVGDSCGTKQTLPVTPPHTGGKGFAYLLESMSVHILR